MTVESSVRALRVMAEEGEGSRPFTAATLRKAADELEELVGRQELMTELAPVVAAARRTLGTLAGAELVNRHPLYVHAVQEARELRDRLEELEPLLLYGRRSS